MNDENMTTEEMNPEGEEEDTLAPGSAPEPDEDVSAFIERALAPDEVEDG